MCTWVCLGFETQLSSPCALVWVLAKADAEKNSLIERRSQEAGFEERS